MKFLFLFLYAQLALAGVILIDGKPVEKSEAPAPRPAPAPPPKKAVLNEMIQSAITVAYDKNIQNIDQLEEQAKKTLEVIKSNLKENLCGQTAFPFNPYTCYASHNVCDFGFKSEYCFVQESLLQCPEGMNRRFARGQLERDFVFCLKSPMVGPVQAPASEEPKQKPRSPRKKQSRR